MKKTISRLSALILLTLLLASCQKEDKKQPTEKTKPSTQSLTQEQKLSAEEKEKLNSEDHGLAGVKEELEKGYRKADNERRLREQKLVVRPGPLTEEEQQFVENVSDGLLMTPEALGSEEAAIKYIKILLKGNHKSIRWSRSAGSEENQKNYYDDAMASALSKINPQSKESIDLVVRVINTRPEYPKALAEAANLLGSSGENKAVPILQSLAKNQNVDIRLNAGRALLLFGDIDNALPVLDELTKEGHTSALGSIFHNMQGKEWQQRGINSIRKALTYDNYESKALAALFMIGLTKKAIIKGNIYSYENLLLTIMTVILSKKKWQKPINGEGYSDHRTLETVIVAFKELKSEKAIPLLKKLEIHPEASYLDKNAKEAIDYIESTVRRK